MKKFSVDELLGGISYTYTARLLGKMDIQSIFALCSNNEQYYRFHPPFVTVESIVEDMSALPTGKDAGDKFFYGYFDGQKLMVLMDLLVDYPAENVAFFGLFMMDKALQGKGAGSRIVSECAYFLKRNGYKKLRLAIDKGNPQSKAFWLKNGFAFTGEEYPNGEFSYLPMERIL